MSRFVPFCPVLASPGLVPEGEGVLRQAQDERMLCRRSAPMIAAVGPGQTHRSAPTVGSDYLRFLF